MKSPGPKILICDDHQIVRKGLERILIDGGIADRIGEAENAIETMAAARREKWDVLILDINLGGRNGIEVLKEIHEQFPRLPVLMLSSYPEDQFALRAIRAGARGYLNKNLAAAVLIEAVQKLLAGGRFLSPEVAEQAIAAIQDPEGQPLHSLLSDREDQVLRLIGAGISVGKIATRLSLSVKTISTYRAILLQKLRLNDNAQLMRYAHEHGLDP